jgi:asparagine synthase (glutamine-hydrolysing)
MRGKIPESVRTRPDKMGFETPDAKWIRAWAPEIETIFRSRSFAERGFFNVTNLLAALKDHVNRVRDCNVDIFRAVQVELYMRSVEGSQ